MNYSKKHRILKKGYLILKSYINFFDIIIKGFCLYFTSRFFRLNFDLKPIWDIDPGNLECNQNSNIEFTVFGIPIDFEKINWHLDYHANFEFPLKRFYKMNIEQYFDKGIDVKFPWEISRFHFAIFLTRAYCKNNEEKYYNQFKWIINDWIDRNPYLYGINWVCTMDVSIRCINWILACNLFGTVFENDREFKKIIGKSLIQHAEYISTLPEIYENNHTTNHTSSNYAGLLFLSLTLQDHPKAGKWLRQAIKGLESCISYQVYDDGVDFEASIPYHRLVLEIFGYSAIICRANYIELSDAYYTKLFKMFEYVAAYVDHNGNAPQVGDNDSGRVLILKQSDDYDHSYLLDLGECIFDHKFDSQCTRRNPDFSQGLPRIDKLDCVKLGITVKRKTDQSIGFVEGGAYILKNDRFSAFVACFPIGMKGRGGHNHYDYGSFTLSYRGSPVIIDPGTFTYTRNKALRNTYKHAGYHNLSFFPKDSWGNLKDDYWQINPQFFLNRKLEFDISKHVIILKDAREIVPARKIELFSDSLWLTDEGGKPFISYIHFNPLLNIRVLDSFTVLIENYNLEIQSDSEFQLIEYNYSPQYNVSLRALKMEMKIQEKLQLIIKSLDQ